MSWKSRFTRSRLTILCRLGILALAIAPAASPMIDIPIAGPGFCVYYSDNTFTEVVGTSSVGCCGEISSTGTTSAFRRCKRIGFCTDVLCPGDTPQ